MTKNNWAPFVKEKKNWQRKFASNQLRSIYNTLFDYKDKLGYSKPWL